VKEVNRVTDAPGKGNGGRVGCRAHMYSPWWRKRDISLTEPFNAFSLLL
jgi:hypothetical protein